MSRSQTVAHFLQSPLQSPSNKVDNIDTDDEVDSIGTELHMLFPSGQLNKQLLIRVLKEVDPTVWIDAELELITRSLPDSVSIEHLKNWLLADARHGEDPSNKLRNDSAALFKDEHVRSMIAQWNACLKDPSKLLDTAASKRSPFKFDSADSRGKIDVNIGVSAVALPDVTSDFGQRFQSVIKQVQHLFKDIMPTGCKRQTNPHISIGSVVLDKKSPSDYNVAILHRSGLIAKVKDQLDSITPMPRAKIQTLKINPDGCVTFQLQHDPAQDVVMSEDVLDMRLSKIPTCQGEVAVAGERKKFARSNCGGYIVTRFQQVRLALGELGCEIKGMYSAGHMVVVNLIDPDVMARLPSRKLEELISKCYDAWSPLVGMWFDLQKVVCLCYVERSLNAGTVVLAPTPGIMPKAFPEDSDTAQSLLKGLFLCTGTGDVLIDVERFFKRTKHRAESQWQSFSGEIWEIIIRVGFKPNNELIESFKIFDADDSGYISVEELGAVMEYLGEKLTEDELAQMMHCADFNLDGRIEYQEFVDMMCKTSTLLSNPGTKCFKGVQSGSLSETPLSIKSIELDSEISGS